MTIMDTMKLVANATDADKKAHQEEVDRLKDRYAELHYYTERLEAQLRVRGILLVTFLVAFCFLVWYIGQI